MSNPVLTLRRQVGVSQSALARRAATSQPTLAAYESGTKSPTVRTLERLASSVGLEFHATFVTPTTREERRSLELHCVIAARLIADPDDVLRRARRNLSKLARQSPHAATLWREWRRVLDREPWEIAEQLVDPRPPARELRHVTPFAGVLRPNERAEAYRRFRRLEGAREP